MPGAVTDAQLTAAILDQLQKTSASPLEPWWAGIITRANTRAYWEIVGRLAERGYLLAQITAWDRLAEFQTDLGVFLAVEAAAAMAPDTYSNEALAYLDRRPELVGDEAKKLMPVAITASGVFQDPQGTAGQAVLCPEVTVSDSFVTPDPQDVRLGQPTDL